MTESQAATTRFCARVAGPFLIVTALLILLRQDTFPILLPALLQEAPLILITGIFTLVLGLIMLTAHHHFGSPTALVLTIVAALLTLRGTLLVLFPEAIISIAGQAVRNPPFLLIVTAITAVVGAWLAYVGWVAKKV